MWPRCSLTGIRSGSETDDNRQASGVYNVAASIMDNIGRMRARLGNRLSFSRRIGASKYLHDKPARAIVQTAARMQAGAKARRNHLAPLGSYLQNHHHVAESFANGRKMWERNSMTSLSPAVGDLGPGVQKR